MSKPVQTSSSLPLRILISGGTGFIGRPLQAFLTAAGHSVVLLSRKQNLNSLHWDPLRGKFPDRNQLENFNVLIHLAGENIAEKRLTASRKKLLRESRVQVTTLLMSQLSQLENPPPVIISASAVGFYGDRGDEVLDENAPVGRDFFSELARDWERATESEYLKQSRICQLRFGVVLSPSGGALAKMLLPFRMGLGAKLGNGEQWMSWIAIDDVIRAINFVVSNEQMNGPINVTSPNPVTNAQFTTTLASTLRRPTLGRIPAIVLKLIFGELAQLALLNSTRAVPAKLSQSGFTFSHPELSGALSHVLGRPLAQANFHQRNAHG